LTIRSVLPHDPASFDSLSTTKQFFTRQRGTLPIEGHSMNVGSALHANQLWISYHQQAEGWSMLRLARFKLDP
jgi:hypothetical protein